MGEAENGAITWLKSLGGEYGSANGSDSSKKPKNSWSGSVSKIIGLPYESGCKKLPMPTRVNQAEAVVYIAWEARRKVHVCQERCICSEPDFFGEGDNRKAKGGTQWRGSSDLFKDHRTNGELGHL